MWEWLWWTGLITFSLVVIEALFVFDFFLVLITEIIGIGDAGLDPLPALPADAGGHQAAARPRALLHEAEVRGPGGDHPKRGGASGRAQPASAAASASTMPIEIRRFGVGHRRPDGPPGTVGVKSQLIHSDGRGLDHRGRVRPRRARRAARQPEHDLDDRHRGRRLGRRRRRADPGRGGRGRALAGRRPPRGLDRALRDARDRRRVRRTPTTRRCAGSSTAWSATPAPTRRCCSRRSAASPSRSTPTRPATSHGTANRPERNAGPAADEPRPGRHLLR